MIIEYMSRNEKDYKDNMIETKIIEYEISESDMTKLSEDITEDYKPKTYLLTNDYSLYYMVVDNIECNYVVIGGLSKDKYILTQYIVKKGLNELLFQLGFSFIK